jgi:hypothetical protein
MRTASEPIAVRRRALVALVEFLAISGLAITQPLLTAFGDAPEVFVEANAEPIHIIGFGILVATIVPLALTGLVIALGALFGRPTFVAATGVLLGCLFAVLGAQAARQFTQVGWLIVATAVVFAVGGLAARRNLAWFATWLRFLAPAPALFLAAFLFVSPASGLLVASDSAAAVPIEAARPGPVVVVVLDELPLTTLLDTSGAIDATRFPGFARLAAESTWFRSTTSVASHTNYAVPAILTGRYPATTDVAALASEHPDNLFRLLGGAFRLNVEEVITRLCVGPRCDPDHPDNVPTSAGARDESTTTVRAPLPSLLSDAVSVLRSQVTGGGARELEDALIDLDPIDISTIASDPGDTRDDPDRKYDRQPARFASWLQRIDADESAPQLSFLHLLAPHRPWRLDAQGNAYVSTESEPTGLGRYAWLERPGAVITQRQRHLEMTRYVDSLVTALQRRLTQLGIWDSATVVVTADHGIGLQAGAPLRYYDDRVAAQVIGVPLFVHAPTMVDGAIVAMPAQTIDVVPTVAAALGVQIPWSVDGRDLHHPPSNRTRHVFEIQEPADSRGNRDYRLIAVDVSSHLEDQLSAARMWRAAEGGALGSWMIGPRAELLGRRASDFEIDESAPTVLTTSDKSVGGQSATNGSGATRALLVGELEGNVEPGTTLVIAVEGVVVSTATIDDDDGRLVVSAFIPPARLQRSGLDIDYYVDRGDHLATVTVA